MIELLWGTALRGTVLLLLAWGATALARRSAADLRHTMWLAALVGMAVLMIPIPAPDAALIRVAVVAAAAAAPQAARAWPLLAALWLSGAILVAMRTAIGIGRLARATRRATPMSGVLISSAISSPCTWGLLRPVILLPASALEWSEEQRRTAIQHESAHIARRDWLWQTFAQAMTAVFWFHPLVWFAAARLREEAELAADDRVLAGGVNAADYAEQLVAAAREIRKGSPLAGVAMVRTSKLTQRIAAILDSSQKRNPATLRARLIIATVALGLTALAAAQSNPKVYRVGEDGVTSPAVAYQVQPDYTQEARDAKISGTVVLQIVIDEQGIAQDIDVRRALGFGLDQQAIAAVAQWRFKPGTKDGNPVRVSAVIEINFKLA